MIRVGMKGDDLVLVLAGPKWPPAFLLMTPLEAADLAIQIKQLLPEDLLNVAPFCSDPHTFGSEMEFRRAGKKLGLLELAEKTGMEPKQLKSLEADDLTSPGAIPAVSFWRLAQALDWSVDEMLRLLVQR
jgi:hypothetical protein